MYKGLAILYGRFVKGLPFKEVIKRVQRQTTTATTSTKTASTATAIKTNIILPQAGYKTDLGEGRSNQRMKTIFVNLCELASKDLAGDYSINLLFSCVSFCFLHTLSITYYFTVKTEFKGHHHVVNNLTFLFNFRCSQATQILLNFLNVWPFSCYP